MPLGDANRRAADDCERQVRAIIEEGKRSFAIETVLSTDKYREIVLRARERGFQFLFVYVLLGSVGEAIERVKIRVSRGGHDVPIDKIRARWPRSLANLKWFWSEATQAYIFFNGDRVEEPLLVAARSEESFTFDPDALACLLPIS